MSIQDELDFQTLLQEQLEEAKVVRTLGDTRSAPPRSRMALLMEDVNPREGGINLVDAPRRFLIMGDNRLLHHRTSRADNAVQSIRYSTDLVDEGFMGMVGERKYPEDPEVEVPILDVPRPGGDE